jgi:hypothetical protein
VALSLAVIRETSVGYLDDMNILSKDERNIVVANEVSRAFKEASGAIFNRNRKTVILGLGSWESRQAWLLCWLQAVQQAKV